MQSDLAGQWSFKWAASVALLVTLPLRAAAQDAQAVTTVTLSGVVLDIESGEAIVDAVVSIPSRSMAVLTGPDGSFELRNVPIGLHVIRVRQLGYQELLRTVTSDSAVSGLDLRLERDPIVLEGLQVIVEGSLTLTGTVTDGSSGAPMTGVFVWLTGEEQGGVSDARGAFRFEEVPTGPQLIQVEHVGYGRQYIPLLVTPPWDPINIVLQPDTDVLVGIPVVANRLRARRNAFLGIVRALDSERLARMEVEDARQVVQNYTFTLVIPCRGSAMSHWCVDVGGEAVEPKVCIDGELMWGGIDELQKYRPHELYLLEVYGTSGLTIRAYTYEHMETLARGKREFLGEEPPPQREGIDGLGWSTSASGGGAPYFGRC